MKKSLKNIPINAVESSVNDVKSDYDDEYDEDADLIRLVEERLANDTGIRISNEEMWKKFGITDEDLKDIEVEFE